MSSMKGKLGALLIKDDLRKLKAYMDYSEYGGAPLLGVKGGVIKAHGSSDAKAIKNAVRQAIKFAEGNVVEDIKQFIDEYSKREKEEASGDEE